MALSAATPAAAAPVAEGPAVEKCYAGRCIARCEPACEAGSRCGETGRCQLIDPERDRLERRLSKGRTMLLVGGTMLGGGALALGVGSAFTFAGEGGDDSDDMFGPFLMLGGTIAASVGLVLFGIGSGVYFSNRSALRELEAERRKVRLSPTLRANGRGFGAGLEIRF